MRRFPVLLFALLFSLSWLAMACGPEDPDPAMDGDDGMLGPDGEAKDMKVDDKDVMEPDTPDEGDVTPDEGDVTPDDDTDSPDLSSDCMADEKRCGDFAVEACMDEMFVETQSCVFDCDKTTFECKEEMCHEQLVRELDVSSGMAMASGDTVEGTTKASWDTSKPGCTSMRSIGNEIIYAFRLDKSSNVTVALTNTSIAEITPLYLRKEGRCSDFNSHSFCSPKDGGGKIEERLDSGLYYVFVDSVSQDYTFDLAVTVE